MKRILIIIVALSVFLFSSGFDSPQDEAYIKFLSQVEELEAEKATLEEEYSNLVSEKESIETRLSELASSRAVVEAEIAEYEKSLEYITKEIELKNSDTGVRIDQFWFNFYAYTLTYIEDTTQPDSESMDLLQNFQVIRTYNYEYNTMYQYQILNDADASLSINVIFDQDTSNIIDLSVVCLNANKDETIYQIYDEFVSGVAVALIMSVEGPVLYSEDYKDKALSLIESRTYLNGKLTFAENRFDEFLYARFK